MPPKATRTLIVILIAGLLWPVLSFAAGVDLYSAGRGGVGPLPAITTSPRLAVGAWFRRRRSLYGFAVVDLVALGCLGPASLVQLWEGRVPFFQTVTLLLIVAPPVLVWRYRYCFD